MGTAVVPDVLSSMADQKPRRSRRRLTPEQARQQLDDLPPTAPYWERLVLLREAAGLSQPVLYRHVEVGFDTVRALEQPYEDQRDGRRSRARYPSAETLEKLAAALNVEPATFPEYKLARARALLDEREVGLEAALSCLEAFDAAQQRLAEEATANEAQPREPTGQRARANGHGSRSPEEPGRAS